MTREIPHPELQFVDHLPKSLQPVWNATKKYASDLGYRALTAEHVLAGLIGHLVSGSPDSVGNIVSSSVGSKVWEHLKIDAKKRKGLLPKRAGPGPVRLSSVALAVGNLFNSAVVEAHLLNHQIPGPEHLLLALFRNDQTRLRLEKAHITREGVLSAIAAVRKEEGAPQDADSLPESRGLDEAAKDILRHTMEKAGARGQKEVGAEHLLATVLEKAASDPNSPILSVFTEARVPIVWFTKVLNLAGGNAEPKLKGEPILTVHASDIIQRSVAMAYHRNTPITLFDIFGLICKSSDGNRVIKDVLECFDLSLPKIQEALPQGTASSTSPK